MSPPPISPAQSPSAGQPSVRNLGDEQALAWFVSLNRPDVNDDQRMAFNRWLGLDPANRRSYEAVLHLWQRLGPKHPESQRI